MAEILAAARQVLEEKGLVGSSVAEIAQLASVSEATVFGYFGTRRDLMFRVIQDWMKPVTDRLENDLGCIEGTATRLRFFVNRHLHELAVAPGMHQLIYRELHWENYYGSELHRLNQRYAGLVSWIIKEGQAAGEVRLGIDVEIARDTVFGTLHHVGWRTFMNGRPLEIEKAAATITAQIVQGLEVAVVQPARLGDLVSRLEAVVAQAEGTAPPIAMRMKKRATPRK